MLRSVLAVLSGPITYGLVCVPTNWLIVTLFPNHFDEQWEHAEPRDVSIACFAYGRIRRSIRIRWGMDREGARDGARFAHVHSPTRYWHRRAEAILERASALVSSRVFPRCWLQDFSSEVG